MKRNRRAYISKKCLKNGINKKYSNKTYTHMLCHNKKMKIKRPKQDFCYTCGVKLKKNNYTRDHIPPKCIFKGFPAKYSRNLVTLKCCNNCNTEFSRYEENLRDLIGISNKKNKLLASITCKSVLNLLKHNKFKRLLFRERKVVGIEFNMDFFYVIDTKCLKGLYTLITGNYMNSSAYMIFPSCDKSKVPQSILDKFNTVRYVYLTHPSIFKFKIIGLSSKMNTVSIKDNPIYIFAQLVYHDMIIRYIFAKNKLFSI